MNQEELNKMVNVAGVFLEKKIPEHNYVILVWGPDGNATADNLPEEQELGVVLTTMGYHLQSLTAKGKL